MNAFDFPKDSRRVLVNFLYTPSMQLDRESIGP